MVASEIKSLPLVVACAAASGRARPNPACDFTRIDTLPLDDWRH